jgi:serine protease AprX
VGAYLPRTYSERHVAGSGTNAYFQLSGTSMAAAEVSGAVALLLDQRRGLSPTDAKALLQLTSTIVPDAGLLGAGAGSVNVLAAATLLDEDAADHVNSISIASEAVFPSGIAFHSLDGCSRACTQHLVRSSAQTIIWGQTITWGQQTGRDQAMGHSDPRGVRKQTIVVSKRALLNQTIIWGQNDSRDTIVWGQHDGSDTIIWGQQDGGDTIIWGQHDDGDTIIWGQQDAGDTIIWGQTVSGLPD